MIPVAIGDTQGTLQARKTWFAMYKHPETFLRLHTNETQMGFYDEEFKLLIFHLLY